MESIITDDIKSFIFSNKLISDHQFDFSSGHSTLDMLLLLTQQWMEVLNVRHEIMAVSLDIILSFQCCLASRLALQILPKASKAYSILGLLTSILIINMWHLMESFNLLSLTRLEFPKAVFCTQSYS